MSKMIKAEKDCPFEGGTERCEGFHIGYKKGVQAKLLRNKEIAEELKKEFDEADKPISRDAIEEFLKRMEEPEKEARK